MFTFAEITQHFNGFTDPEDPYKITDKTRNLGLVVCRGSAVMCLYPTDGMEEIANPFLDAM